MRCKHLYFLSPNLELVGVGGLCKKHHPTGLYCIKDEYHRLCRFGEYDPQGTPIPPKEIAPPAEVEAPREIVQETKEENEKEVLRTQPGKKAKRGRSIIR